MKTHAASLVVVLALFAGLTGCGGYSGAPKSDTATELQIIIWPKGRRTTIGRILGERRTPVGKSETRTLRCDPVGGTLPHAKSVCDKLAQLDDPFAETPEDTVCAQVMDGEQFAVVQGVLRDETVNARFERINGCEIARWDKHAFLFDFKS